MERNRWQEPRTLPIENQDEISPGLDDRVDLIADDSYSQLFVTAELQFKAPLFLKHGTK